MDMTTYTPKKNPIQQWLRSFAKSVLPRELISFVQHRDGQGIMTPTGERDILFSAINGSPFITDRKCRNTGQDIPGGSVRKAHVTISESTMDTAYENQYFQSEHGTSWNFKQLPFPNIPDEEVVQRFKSADNSLAIMAHPTSWWMQKRGDVEKYVTNVAGNLSFGLLSGKIWDGVVAMGYDHDHYFYQNLWFNILNQGYRMPAFSELDGGLGKDDKFYYGSMRTYFHVDGDFSIKKMTAAVKGKELSHFRTHNHG